MYSQWLGEPFALETRRHSTADDSGPKIHLNLGIKQLSSYVKLFILVKLNSDAY